ncbi:Nitrilase and fragile histidine triad fusion protein NitFhit [Hypsibius exemplaris]|uniref:Nitrilase and fragile histidine triad fusion protein NitFhit n=1 Tax=Hypsibius exemplaris TaxID=2072580 RepID=A0A1W0WM92_HYPEX|nr:Nitrilase and fragile histidine triad fusion protein NitFhit [Hypsibius exemplaris]
MTAELEPTKKSLVAVLQFTATADKARNLQQCGDLILAAKQLGAKMVFLPEGFDYVSETSEQSMQLSESLTGPTITAYRNMAKEHSLWLSLGGFHLKDEKEKRTHNSHILLNSSGDIVANYRKTHLFAVNIPGKVTLDENAFCIPGSAISLPVPTPFGKIALMCCYDLRFSELASILTRQGAEILTYPSAFTSTTGVAHWEILLRARAIENQCYVVAAAQCGSHNSKRTSFGHAMIVDPWGAVIANCLEESGVAVAEIDLEKLLQVRLNMPVQSHRRHDLYRLNAAPVALPDFTAETHNFGGHIISRNEIFYETRLTLALVNLKPIVPGHSLVIPKRCVQKFVDLTEEEVADLFHVVQKVEAMLEQRYQVNSSMLTIQDGVDAGQTVKHLHVHLVPRRPNDFAKDEVYRELDRHDKDNRKARLPEDMAAEAREYRKLMYGDALHWTFDC